MVQYILLNFVGIHLKYYILYLKRCLSVPSHYQNWLQIIDTHPRAISQNISKIWWQLLASPVLLGSQRVNPCLPNPMHDWAAEAAKHDPASSLNTVSHQTALRNIMFRSREWSTCLLNWEKIYGYSYIWHITEHCQIADQYYSSYAYQS